ncbi:MAG: dTMP kinase [Planctomycetota bacterium]
MVNAPGAAAARPASSRSGLLIAFEGLDGCGKSTQLERCARWLAGRLATPPLRVREPGGTPLGEAVRALLLAEGAITPQAEMLLYMACRAELYERVVLPALARGETVLLDRSHYSTAAYQGAGLGLDLPGILELARLATGGRPPDRVLLFELPAAAAAGRLAGRAEPRRDRIEARDAEYFERVAAGYRALARAEPERFVVLDAQRSPEAIEEAVRKALADVL